MTILYRTRVSFETPSRMRAAAEVPIVLMQIGNSGRYPICLITYNAQVWIWGGETKFDLFSPFPNLDIEAILRYAFFRRDYHFSIHQEMMVERRDIG